MKLEIISPDGILFDGEVQRVALPGVIGSFEILPKHAPLISALGQGEITYETDQGENKLAVGDGFVQVDQDVISICIEQEKNHE